MRQPSYCGQFRRDVKQAQKRGEDMEKLKALLAPPVEGRPLPAIRSATARSRRSHCFTPFDFLSGSRAAWHSHRRSRPYLTVYHVLVRFWAVHGMGRAMSSTVFSLKADGAAYLRLDPFEEQLHPARRRSASQCIDPLKWRNHQRRPAPRPASHIAPRPKPP